MIFSRSGLKHTNDHEYVLTPWKQLRETWCTTLGAYILAFMQVRIIKRVRFIHFISFQIKKLKHK
jgi:hypothetical protein